MRIIYSIFLIFIFLAELSSQNLVTKISHRDTRVFYKHYTYDESNRLIEEWSSTYYKEENFTTPKVLDHEWFYDDLGRLNLRYDYKLDFRDDQNKLHISYHINYDENGLMESQLQKFHLPENTTKQIHIDVINEYDGTVPWRHEPEHLFIRGFQNDIRLTRRRVDNEEVEVYEEFNDETQEWEYEGTFARKYNQQDNVIEEYLDMYYPYGNASRRVFNYDATGEILIGEEYYFQNEVGGEWEKEHEFEYIYEDSLLVKQRSRYGTNPWGERLNEYYCDGLLKRTSSIDEVVYKTFSFQLYEYDEVTDCPDNIDKQLEESIRVYPNPAKNILFIESDLFHEDACQVYLYDLNGILLHSEQTNSRLTRIKYNIVQDMPSMKMIFAYIITDDGRSAVEKIFIE